MCRSRKQGQLCVISQRHRADKSNNKEHDSLRRGCSARWDPAAPPCAQGLPRDNTGSTHLCYCCCRYFLYVKRKNPEIFPYHQNKDDVLTLILLRINSATALKQAYNFFKKWSFSQRCKTLLQITFNPYSQNTFKSQQKSIHVKSFYLSHYFLLRNGTFSLNPDYSLWLNQWLLWETKNEAVVKGSSGWERIEFIIWKSKMLDTLTVSSLCKKKQKILNWWQKAELAKCSPPLLKFSCTSKISDIGNKRSFFSPEKENPDFAADKPVKTAPGVRIDPMEMWG